MRCNKKVCMFVAGAGLAVAFLAASARKKGGAGQDAQKRAAKWDKMRRRMEEMPEDFPPRMMFDNIQTTKANTERILEILEQPTNSAEPGVDDEVKTST